MARPRRPPRPRVVAPSAKIAPTRKTKERGRKRKNHVGWEDRDELSDTPNEDPADEEIERTMAFCCFTCKCSEERKVRVQGDTPDAHEGVRYYIQTDSGMFFHRRCCHGAFEKDNGTFAGPFEAASTIKEKILMGEIPPIPPEQPIKYTKSQVQGKYESSYKRQEITLHNQDNDVTPDSVLNSSPEYLQNRLRFDSLVTREKKPCVVLDTFAGIGTGIVVLKRLGIAMTKVIHVEHDKVATHVYRWNNDPEYNPNLLGDGIEHYYVSKFEEIEKDLDSFLKEHGPIDVVIGGPPCVDFSLVNANRQGVDGNQGSYMIRFGQLIQSIRDKQRDRDLFFCAENVPLINDSNKALTEGDKSQIQEAFGTKWDPIELDAWYCSPCVRKRHFFTDIPYDDFDHNTPLSMITPTKCLAGGYKLAAHHVEDELMCAKAWTFMASATKIDDERMLVFRKEEDNSYTGRCMTAEEREVIMGYPRGYVSKSVDKLFQELLKKGLSNVVSSGPHWKETLHKDFHHFNGAYHDEPDAYQVEVNAVEPDDQVEVNAVLTLKMLPRGSSRTFFDAEEYAKRLVGNAYSVPVMEHLLKPLRQIFSARDYPAFQYKYAWDAGDEERRRDSSCSEPANSVSVGGPSENEIAARTVSRSTEADLRPTEARRQEAHVGRPDDAHGHFQSHPCDVSRDNQGYANTGPNNINSDDGYGDRRSRLYDDSRNFSGQGGPRPDHARSSHDCSPFPSQPYDDSSDCQGHRGPRPDYSQSSIGHGYRYEDSRDHRRKGGHHHGHFRGVNGHDHRQSNAFDDSSYERGHGGPRPEHARSRSNDGHGHSHSYPNGSSRDYRDHGGRHHDGHSNSRSHRNYRYDPRENRGNSSQRHPNNNHRNKRDQGGRRDSRRGNDYGYYGPTSAHQDGGHLKGEQREHTRGGSSSYRQVDEKDDHKNYGPHRESHS